MALVDVEDRVVIAPPAGGTALGTIGDQVVLTESTNVARAQDGDADAFERLVDGYQGELFRLAFRIVHDRGDSEDVVQETFIVAWRRLPSLIDPDAFHAWIYRIATRQAFNAIRARERRKTFLASSTSTDTEIERRQRDSVRPDDPAEMAQASARGRSLDQLLLTLPLEQRTCWVLKELHNLSYREISYALGVPVSTVRGRIARARHYLATGMAPWR